MGGIVLVNNVWLLIKPAIDQSDYAAQLILLYQQITDTHAHNLQIHITTCCSHY